MTIDPALDLIYRKERVTSYLYRHPQATAQDLKNAGLGFDLGIAYNGRINDARKDVGIKPKNIKKVIPKETSRKRILDYLQKHPEAESRDILKAELWPHLMRAFCGRLSDARETADIDIGEVKRERSAASILFHLRKNPEYTYDDLVDLGLKTDLKIAYNHNINQARLDAGIRPKKLKSREPKRKRRERIISFLRKNRYSITGDLIEAGLWADLKYVYKSRINAARKDAGITEREIRQHKQDIKEAYLFERRMALALIIEKQGWGLYDVYANVLTKYIASRVTGYAKKYGRVTLDKIEEDIAWLRKFDRGEIN